MHKQRYTSAGRLTYVKSPACMCKHAFPCLTLLRASGRVIKVRGHQECVGRIHRCIIPCSMQVQIGRVPCGLFWDDALVEQSQMPQRLLPGDAYPKIPIDLPFSKLPCSMVLRPTCFMSCRKSVGLSRHCFQPGSSAEGSCRAREAIRSCNDAMRCNSAP